MSVEQESPLVVIDRFRDEFFFLSNMFRVEPNGIEFNDNGNRLRVPTSEHIYEAGRFVDPEDKAYVLSAPNGLKARNRARHLIAQGNKLSYTDDEGRINLMQIAIDAKFAAGTRMASMLMNTGDALLVEGNSWDDNFWGCDPPQNPEGSNHLGLILMARREVIRTAK